jgi:CRISPR/Cas system CMR-associated protein Cmr1 (group 7 of RAMP superfamily)
MNILRTVTLDRINRKKDKSVSITFITDNEQTSEQFMELDKQLDQRGVLYFKPKGLLTTAEADELDAVDIELEGKSQSQRLRNVLYILWQQTNHGEDFKTFYKDKTEKIIEQIKNKLA